MGLRLMFRLAKLLLKTLSGDSMDGTKFKKFRFCDVKVIGLATYVSMFQIVTFMRHFMNKKFTLI